MIVTPLQKGQTSRDKNKKAHIEHGTQCKLLNNNKSHKLLYKMQYLEKKQNQCFQIYNI